MKKEKWCRKNIIITYTRRRCGSEFQCNFKIFLSFSGCCSTTTALAMWIFVFLFSHSLSYFSSLINFRFYCDTFLHTNEETFSIFILYIRYIIYWHMYEVYGWCYTVCGYHHLNKQLPHANFNIVNGIGTFFKYKKLLALFLSWTSIYEYLSINYISTGKNGRKGKWEA